MKRILFFLIEKTYIQTVLIAVLLITTILLRCFCDKINLNRINYFLLVLNSLFIFWVFINLFFVVVKSENNNLKTIHLRKFDDFESIQGMLFKLIAILFIGARTYFVLDRPGVILSLSLTTISAILSIYTLIKCIKKDKSKDSNKEGLVLVLIYLYFMVWKGVFCFEFGVEKIGAYFEKETYDAKYYVIINNSEDYVSDKLPAEIIVSSEFSEFESYESEGITMFSEETTQTEEERYVKVKNIELENGKILYFKDCFASTNNLYDCECDDQYGKDWYIEMTDEAVK
jgi:hypothetical protein